MTGQLQDSNACWLSAALIDAGIIPIEHCAVGDVLDDLVATIRRAASRAPLVIMSGGLGPTDGDLTREAICRATNDTLILDDALRAELAAKLTRRGREASERQQRQSHRPSRGTALPNAFGTAPGLHVRSSSRDGEGQSDIFCLPGPPGELRPMFLNHVLPALCPPPGRAIFTRLIQVVGIPEADCVERLGDLTKRDRVPLVGITASGGILTLRIRDAGGDEGALKRVDDTDSQIRAQLGDHALPLVSGAPASGTDHLASHVLSALRGSGQPARTLAVVESCTGGMLGEMLTDIPGASSVFCGGFITYSNGLKERLGVRAKTLQSLGAVSPETAREMAMAGLREANSDHCLSITGIAGPDGGSAAKPVGTVHIALATRTRPTECDPYLMPSTVHSRHFRFTGTREDIRRRSCMSALTMLHFLLSRGEPGVPRLLWEVA